MGLLDDAIREHMELKRLRGADPAVVAREERDALGPVVPEDEDDAAGTSAAAGGGGAGFAGVGQETAELDMRTVLDEQHEAVDRAGQIDSADAFHAHGENAHGEEPEGVAPDRVDPDEVEDVLEETPEFLRDTPEQERLWFEQQGPRDFDFDG